MGQCRLLIEYDKEFLTIGSAAFPGEDIDSNVNLVSHDNKQG